VLLLYRYTSTFFISQAVGSICGAYKLGKRTMTTFQTKCHPRHQRLVKRHMIAYIEYTLKCIAEQTVAYENQVFDKGCGLRLQGSLSVSRCRKVMSRPRRCSGVGILTELAAIARLRKCCFMHCSRVSYTLLFQ